MDERAKGPSGNYYETNPRLGWNVSERSNISFSVSRNNDRWRANKSAPDILLYDHKLEKTFLIIEVTHSTGVKKDTAKVLNLMKDYEVQEGFVYDYKKNVWHKMTSSLGEAVDSSFSDV